MRFTAAAIGTGVGVLSLFVFLLPPDKHPLLIPHFSLDHLGSMYLIAPPNLSRNACPL